MKKVLIALCLVLALAVPVSAQWLGGLQVGETYTHQSRSTADYWFSATHATSTSLELAGYTKVRADYDLGATTTAANVNLQCSNDSLWISGDSIAVTEDTYATYNLMGCKDYNFYVESIQGTTPTLTIYLTPYNGEYNGE